jgi:aryl-alcohol dehydrogenase-like predicted oxidoreductase
MHYSLVGRDVERDVVPMMARYGLGMTVWSPLASGFLSGNTHGRICRIPTTACPASTSCPSTRTVASCWSSACGRWRPRAAQGVAQLAIAWLLAKPGVTSVLLGCQQAASAGDNLGAAAVRLSAEEVAALDALTTPSEVYPNWFIERLVDAKQRDALG